MFPGDKAERYPNPFHLCLKVEFQVLSFTMNMKRCLTSLITRDMQIKQQ